MGRKLKLRKEMVDLPDSKGSTNLFRWPSLKEILFSFRKLLLLKFFCCSIIEWNLAKVNLLQLNFGFKIKTNKYIGVKKNFICICMDSYKFWKAI